jgi:L-aminopeptidase/D-esterase-like protein
MVISFDLPFTAIPGVRVGHAQDMQALTGVTVVLCEAGAVGGVDQRGGAPGTRQTDALYPMHLVDRVHAVVLAGGSAFGLDSAGGVMRYLEERGVGFDVRVAHVPIVPTAILFDLAIGRADIRPDAVMGYQACLNATTDKPEDGCVGAGTGCTVGKTLGLERAMKSGIGGAAIDLGGGLLVGALVAVNAFGDVIDPSNDQILAGARRIPDVGLEHGANRTSFEFADARQVLREIAGKGTLAFGRRTAPPAAANTVIGVVATNARLNKEQANKVAQMAQDGLARCVRPAHTMLDGDTLFALCLGEVAADVNIVGAFAAEAVSAAILRAVQAARSLGGLPGLGDKIGA